VTTPSSGRHLVERAMEAMQGTVAPDPRPPASARATAGTETADRAAAPPATPPSAAAVATPPAPAAAPAVAPAARPVPARGDAITLEALQKAGFVVPGGASARSRVTEELNVVQHQIRRTVQATEASEGRIPRLVLFTSARPGEGKTFCSLNVAARLAMSSAEQVILVDGDSKQTHSITHLLEHDKTPGLRTLAQDPMQRPDHLLIPTAVDRLTFMAYGPAAPGQSGLPSGAMLANAVSRLAAAMPNRIIVLDAPPALYTSEPTALASVAGQVVLVVRAESTQRDEVEGALDMVESCPNLQLLLNRTRLTSNNTFGAYDYYGYYSG
jgi:receptor protein-tyrosine kinase